MQEEWRPIEEYPAYEISSINGYIRWAEDKERVYITHDGKGLRLVWFYNERGRAVALKKVGDLWKKTWPELVGVVTDEDRRRYAEAKPARRG